MPVGAFGGRADIMDHLAPQGPVYQAGTLSGNPIAMTAGLTGLKILEETNPYGELQQVTQSLLDGLKLRAKSRGLPFTTHQVGSMFGLFFNDDPNITNFEKVKQSDIELFKAFFHGMLQQGVHFAPSAFEAGFMSTAHSDHDIQFTLDAADKVFAKISQTVAA